MLHIHFHPEYITLIRLFFVNILFSISSSRWTLKASVAKNEPKFKAFEVWHICYVIWQALPRLSNREKVVEMVDPALQGQYSKKDLIQVILLAIMIFTNHQYWCL